MADYLAPLIGNFNEASGGSEAYTNIKYIELNYSTLQLITDVVEGDLAYLKESQGSIESGDYYPEGWYTWKGTEWVSDRNFIINQFIINQTLLSELEANKLSVPIENLPTLP